MEICPCTKLQMLGSLEQTLAEAAGRGAQLGAGSSLAESDGGTRLGAEFLHLQHSIRKHY